MKNNIIILFIFLSFGHLLSAQSPKEKIQALLDEIQKEHPETGISIGIRYEDKITYHHRGNLERNGAVPIDEYSVFEIASITKLLTGNLIAQAIQEEKIKATDYMDAYLPAGFQLQKGIQKKIRITDLASHQSGLPDIDFPKLIAQNPQQPIQSITKDTIYKIINDCNRLKDYGSYRYSTVGFVLLGQILEQLYGKSYEAIVKENIIVPLQLKRTLTKDFQVKNITHGYNLEGGEQELFHWNIVAPAGLIKSSAADMMTYLNAISTSNGTFREAAILAEKKYYQDENIIIGLGLNILEDSSHTIYAKTGDSLGQSSVMAYDGKGKWAVVILLNQHNSKLRSDLFNAIYEILQ
ncbi:serine hydrolase domain-containing protein [Spongiimicrobium salis]|uniref:serine hydrolase domain-containing protein n=1 Tax=Spongiimicrobium salis TaxID=1667022 RepID=UPI00374D506C